MTTTGFSLGASSISARGEDTAPPQLSLLCGWSTTGQGMRRVTASAAHTMSSLIMALPPGLGWEEALEGCLLGLTVYLPGVMDINFPTDILGQSHSSVFFTHACIPNLCSSEARREPGRASLSLRHGNPEWSASPARSWMLSDNDVLIKDLSLKYFRIIKEKRNEKE